MCLGQGSCLHYFCGLRDVVSQVVFLKVDVDKNQETAQAQGIRAMPTFKVFRSGKEVYATQSMPRGSSVCGQVAMMKGADKDGLKKLLQEHGGDKWSAAGSGQALGAPLIGVIAWQSLVDSSS